MKRAPLVALALLIAASGTGCGADVEHAAHREGPAVTRAIAVMQPTEGSQARGIVTFTRVADGVRVEADFTGLTPGKHGFHVHQWGDVSGSDGKSAGGHFDPHGAEHALPAGEPRHVGDLGNLEADASGAARYERVDSLLAFRGTNSIVGRGLIVHALEDDGGQPTGNAGARVAMGVIGIADAGDGR
ncbi:MAG: superoxide dismutase family protein [Myxococcales bacterium]|nr:superoxide dismutase family protein [Myxococcales bacterium]